MKIFRYIATLMILILGASCDTDVEKPTLVSKSDVVAPVMKDCADIVINANNLKEEIILSWEKAYFGQAVQIQYLVYMTYRDKTVRLGTSFNPGLNLTKEYVNTLAMEDLGMLAHTKNDAVVYVDAELYNGTVVYPVVSSEKKNITVTPWISVD